MTNFTIDDLQHRDDSVMELRVGLPVLKPYRPTEQKSVGRTANHVRACSGWPITLASKEKKTLKQQLPFLFLHTLLYTFVVLVSPGIK